MDTHDFTATVTVAKPPHAVFAAINDPRGWWGRDIDGDTDRLGAEWTYRYKDMHRSTQKVVALEPDTRVVWQVIDADISFLQDRGEWKGTEIVFDIAPCDAGSELRFTHRGLVPQVECYDVCTDAWSGLIRESLRAFIETGKGAPDTVER